MASTFLTPQHSLVLRALLHEYVFPRWKGLLRAAACMTISAICMAMLTNLVQPMVDDILIRKNALLLFPISLSFLGIFIVKGLCDYGESIFLARFGQEVLTDIQVRCFRHILHADVELLRRASTGELVSRLTSDVNQLRYMVTSALIDIGKNTLTVVGLISVMFYHDPELASIAFLVFPAALWPARKIGRRVRKIAGHTQAEIGAWSSFLTQSFQGIRVIKAYGMEHYEETRARAIARRVCDLTLHSTRVRSIVHPVMEALGGISICLIILIGGWFVIQGTRTAGALFAFLGALAVSYRPVKSLSSLNATLQEGLAAAQRLYAILETAPRVVDKPQAVNLSRPRGRVTFRGVSFSYPSGAEALSELSFTVEPGQRVALVGASGAGKSTLLSLLLRFYDPSAGEIFIDDYDISAVTQASLRKTLSLVSQDIVLFDDTIRANIAYGWMDAPLSRIEDAARAAAAHEFIAELPMGYDTPIGENGLSLSGGQRQRLSIARAMLRDTPILLLDEATSALDGASEQQVQLAFSRLTRGRTTLIIAHRLSTILDADEIFVLNRGKLIERGRHEDLLARRGVYAQLYTSQAFKEKA